MTSPTPEQIRQARQSAGLTQSEAAKVVYATTRTWERWEAGDRKMSPATYEFFLIRTGQIK